MVERVGREPVTRQLFLQLFYEKLGPKSLLRAVHSATECLRPRELPIFPESTFQGVLRPCEIAVRPCAPGGIGPPHGPPLSLALRLKALAEPAAHGRKRQ